MVMFTKPIENHTKQYTTETCQDMEMLVDFCRSVNVIVQSANFEINAFFRLLKSRCGSDILFPYGFGNELSTHAETYKQSCTCTPHQYNLGEF